MLGGCALFQETPKPLTSLSPQEKVFRYSFDQVWLATQRAIQQYPMRVNNMDLKILETDYISSDKYWNPPHLDKLTAGDEYQLKIRVISGEINGEPAHKVSVLKDIVRKKDFFSETKKIPSNGFEERAILYRINRELVIERALERTQKKINENMEFE